MRTKTRISLLAAGLTIATINGSVLAQNQFNAGSPTPETLSFDDQNNWANGGPDSWGPNAHQVNGLLQFDMSLLGGLGNQILVESIFGTYTGISGITTTGGNAESSLTLTGPGIFSMSNPQGDVLINPTVELNLDINLVVSGNLVVDTSGMANQLVQFVNFAQDLIMADPGATLTITNAGGLLGGVVVFESGSSLSMNGTIVVGTNGDLSDQVELKLDGGAEISGNIALQIWDGGTVNFGADSVIAETQYVFSSINGNGVITNTDGVANLLINGGTVSNFSGHFNLGAGSSLTVSGQGTTLILGAGEGAVAAGPNPSTNVIDAPNFGSEGGLFIEDGAIVVVTPVIPGIDGFATLQAPVSISGGGIFGGNGLVNLVGTFPSNAFNISDGWLMGGSRTGEGQLVLGGLALGFFGDDSGLLVNYDHTGYQQGETSAHTDPYIALAGGALIPFNFLPGTNIHVNLLIDEGDSWISDQTQLTILSNGQAVEGIFVDITNGDWDGSTNLVTRYLDIETDTQDSSFSELYAYIRADYEKPAGELSGIGSYLNSLVATARTDPEGTVAELLASLDAQAGSLATYQSALATGIMPQSQMVAERVTADNMYSNVARRNIREVAIGTRGPGMLKADAMSNPMLLASLQEADALPGAINNSPPQVIVNGEKITPKKETNSDVFQTLFLDGYGQWSRMDQVGNVVGYDASTYGVATGWGLALADGLTVGLTAGWENSSVTLDYDLGDATVNSFRGTPFISWSGSTGDTEQYGILSIGGGYNTVDGVQKSSLAMIQSANYSLTGWEFDLEGTVGTRVPLSESFALQPEASMRYSLLEYSGNLNQPGMPESDYKGGDFNYFTGRIGTNIEWLMAPSLRLSAGVGYQGQSIDYGTAQFEIPGGIPGASQTIRESGGNGTINQVYTGVQLLWAPSWNTSLSVSYDGAFGDGEQNAITGGLLIRF